MTPEEMLRYAASTGDECAIEVEALRSRLAEAERLLWWWFCQQPPAHFPQGLYTDTAKWLGLGHE